MPDEHEQIVDAMFQKFIKAEVNFISTQLLKFEVINGLKSAVVSKRLSHEKIANYINDFLLLGIGELEVDLSKTVDLAMAKGLSVYDASYLALSEAENCQLLSLDKRLKN